MAAGTIVETSWRLIRRRPVPVPFYGRTDRDGPLTLGQLNILRWMTAGDKPAYATIGCAVDLPEKAGVTDVAKSVAVLLARHEGLRTVFDLGDPPRQHVLGSGVLPLHVYAVEAEPAVSVDPDVLATELGARLRADASYHPGRLPLHIAVAVRGRTVGACVAGFSHLVVDEWGMQVVRAELAEMIRDPAARRVGGIRHQPLDQAAVEGTPEMRRRATAALNRWAELLPRLPQCHYPAPRAGAAGGSVAVEMSSPAAAAALRVVAARTRVSRSSVVLAAVCAVLARRTGNRSLVFPTLSGNRFERSLTGYVGTLVQSSLTVVDVDGAPFDTLARRAWAAVVEAGRHGVYDIDGRAELTRQVERRRGVRLDFEPLFNSTVIESGTIAHDVGPGPCGPTTVHARTMPPTPTLIRFDLYEVDGAVRLSLWTGDTGRLPTHEAESLLRAVERLLVVAARSDVDAEDMEHAIGLEPIPRGAGWLRVDSQWVELAEVRRLLETAFGEGKARLFAKDGSLLAYVIAGKSARSPEEARARCLAALEPGSPATVPRWFIICHDYPDDPMARSSDVDG